MRVGSADGDTVGRHADRRRWSEISKDKKNKTNLDVGNIVTKESMKAEFKSKPLETQWKVKAKAYKKMGFDFNWVQKKLKKKLGIDKPPGVKWNSL